MRTAIAVFLLLLMAAPAYAQDEEEKKPVDLAVAFPSTTMVYLRADTSDYFDALNPQEMFAGLENDLKLPDLGEIARDRLELELSDEEIAELTRGVRGSAFGLLDVGVSGPKFQVVVDHQHLGALARALKSAHAAGMVTVPDVQDYDGTPIYELELPLPASTPRDDFSADLNPLGSWLSNESLWVAIFNNRYLVIATSDNAVKDSIDFLAFPDDPFDTLLGNARYREAVADFDKPQAVFFVNVQAVINTMERLAGDKGSSGPLQEILQYYMGGNNQQVQFFFGLLQYEQFKSFAAGFWLDEKALTLRMDANLVFHNPPGWFETVRIEPKAMPLTEFIPGDAMFAITDCVDDVSGMYRDVREFFFERAKAAGQQALVDGWQGIEKEIEDDKASLDGALAQLGVGQAFVVLPRGTPEQSDNVPVEVAGILGLKNRRQAEEFFYAKLLGSKLGAPFRYMEGEITPVLMLHGVEIHQDEAGNVAYAFMDSELNGKGESGVLVIGMPGAVKRIVAARYQAGNLKTLASWQAAKGLLWDAGSTHMYLNFGALLRILSNAFTITRFWYEDEVDDKFERDDTEKDDDPIPFLSDFFRNTIVLGSARSSDNGISVRLAAAGWPDRRQMRGMGLHYRDVGRNQQVRDDFVRVREAARTHLAIKGKPATEVKQLIESGQLEREEWGVDPYGFDADDGKTRHYALAPVPADVNIREPILCAYQAQPGLRGNHLAVLWNSHVVELTPDGLKKALELAKAGKPLPPDGDWYREALKPLHSNPDPRRKRASEYWEEEDTRVDVAIIDDEGDVAIAKVEEADLMKETEAILNANNGAKKD